MAKSTDFYPFSIIGFHLKLLDLNMNKLNSMKLIIFTLSLIFSSTFLLAQTEVVFETSQFVMSSDNMLISKNQKTHVRYTCDDFEPAFGCVSFVHFCNKKLPSIVYQGIVGAVALTDLVKDGTLECILLIEPYMGYWNTIYVYTLAVDPVTHKSVWYNPIPPFEWYPNFDSKENCPARILFDSKSNNIEIYTTDALSEERKCNLLIQPKWIKF